MAAIKRSSKVVWEGTIARGAGRLSADSGAFTALPVTVASRFGEPEGKTSPEELIAAAHATCFTMGWSWRVSTRRPSGSPSTQ
jgi:lipoyl-dependent peroxiredoxin